MTLLKSQARFEAQTLEELVRQLNEYAARHQGGGLMVQGLRLQMLEAAPTGAPGPNQPNLVAVNNAGVVKLYVWTGAAWVVVGTQT